MGEVGRWGWGGGEEGVGEVERRGWGGGGGGEEGVGSGGR